MNCPRCATPAEPGAAFCGVCGGRVDTTIVEPTATSRPSSVAGDWWGGASAAPTAPPPTFAAPNAASFAVPITRAAPGPPPAPPPSVPFAAAPAAPAPMATVGPKERSPHRTRRWVFATLGIVGVGIAAYVGWLVLKSGDTAKGGATSPAGVAKGLVDALNQQDLAGASTFIAPSELPDLSAFIEALQTTATSQGVSGLSKGGGIDVTIDLQDATASDLATDVAQVDLTLTVAVKGNPAGPLGNLIGKGATLRPRPGTDIHLIVVKESGKWFASPLLTLGDYVAKASNLPGPDFAAAADRDQGQTASTPSEAFDQLAQAITDRDVRNAGAVLGVGEGRFVRVFDRAIQKLVSRADPNVPVTIDRVEVQHNKGDLWALSRFDVTVANTETGETTTSSVRDGCLERSGRDPACLFDYLPLTKRLDSDQILVHVSTTGGRARIQLAATAVDYATQIVTRLSREAALRALNLEVYDTPVEAAVNQRSTITFTGDRFKVVEFDVAANTEYLAHTTADHPDSFDEVQFFRQNDSGHWVDDTFDTVGTDVVLQTSDTATKIRAVVRVASDSCDPGLECHYPDASLDFAVNHLQVVPSQPGTIVEPNIDAGKSLVVRFTGTASKRYEVSTTTPNVTIQSLYYGELGQERADADGFFTPISPGPQEFLITNNGPALQRVAITIIEHDPSGGE